MDYVGPALEAGVSHAVLVAMDGSYEAASEPVAREVIGSEAAP